MNRRAVAAAVTALTAAGCGTTHLRDVRLDPPARAEVTDRGASVTVQDVGIERRVRWRWADDRVRLGVTVEVQPAGDGLIIDPAGSALEVESSGSARRGGSGSSSSAAAGGPTVA
jgi:hypothetical protein